MQLENLHNVLPRPLRRTIGSEDINFVQFSLQLHADHENDFSNHVYGASHSAPHKQLSLPCGVGRRHVSSFSCPASAGNQRCVWKKSREVHTVVLFIGDLSFSSCPAPCATSYRDSCGHGAYNIICIIDGCASCISVAVHFASGSLVRHRVFEPSLLPEALAQVLFTLWRPFPFCQCIPQ